ncbi:MAG: Putative dipeptidase [Candidatus Kapaibacterium sp.]|nr:MAG: Putative dipeptidase [Candidatus Kapabacteria bacterium]
MIKKLFLFGIIIIFGTASLYPCTNILVTKGASVDGSVMISYNADAGGFMEPLYFSPARDWGPNDSIEIYDWDTHKYLGKIKQVPHTYQVVGLINEYQVSIGETTFGGREELRDTTGIIDYGSLMQLALQRAKTAREAIKVMTSLVAEYGYYSEGESFSIADPNEVWIMEMIGKGPGRKGAVWVALRIPDGYISAHANHSRIREFPLNDPENCMYAPDVISFAIEKGYYKPSDGPFSFSDVYDPPTPGSLLYCEGRVWSIFRRAAPSQNFPEDYWRAVKGAKPYPLWIKPDKKLSVRDVINLMRDHFDGTPYDLKKGLAAGPFGCPVRWKPLVWKIEGDTNEYAWERPISTQQTAFAFVSQLRAWLPRQIGGIHWYGVDDNYTNVYIPIYCSIKEPPECFRVGSISNFTLESAFWIFNLVANWAYTKYSYMYEDIRKVQKELEDKFFDFQPAIEKVALELYKTKPELAVDFLTDYSISQSNLVMRKWRQLWEYLVMKYNDGYVNDVTKDHGRKPKGVGYGNEFFKMFIKERPGYYDVKWREKPETFYNKEGKATEGSK